MSNINEHHLDTSMALTATNNKQLSTDVFQKLLYVFYYYYRCFGIVVSHSIRRCSRCANANANTDNHQQHNNIDDNGYVSITTDTPAQMHRRRFAFHAYEQNFWMWFTIVNHLICCVLFLYGALTQWFTDDYLFSRFILLQSIAIGVCPVVSMVAHFWYRKRLLLATNAMLRLLTNIEQFHANYSIFQWTHVPLVALMLVSLVLEIACSVDAMVEEYNGVGTWYSVALLGVEMYLVIGLWMSLHVASMLYLTVDAMYGSLNHYLRFEFIPRLRETQEFVTSPPHVLQMRRELTKFTELFKRIHYVGMELHHMLQIPVVNTIFYLYNAMICIIYYLIWQYFGYDQTRVRFFPYVMKQIIDIVILSLTAHRAIKRSQLITCLGLENVLLVEENVEWNRQMELFLYHINLHEFKLNILGLFDITNTLTLTFISGILTSISIFIPFTIKSSRMQMFLENRT